ncbi:Rhodanese domain protein [Isosphaera pallida ATCC 43644]|uniref:Rhodanese domain protein n=2 Tax=Isosphaera pallida TaxID=128 RepID=E8R360_ISOPI|nr:Rhodanese domain protein [Isosphaera pallida ATCC 43644]
MALAVGGGWTARVEAQPAKEVVEPKSGLARLMSFQQLANLIEKSDAMTPLRILDARPREQYDQGHLPGAVWVDPKAVEEMSQKPGALTNREVWEHWLAPLGISPETLVVVVDDHRQLDAARIWWLLTYLGVGQVALLDGNHTLWVERGLPVTRDVPQVEPWPFKVRFRKERLADREQVRRLLDGELREAMILDARSAQEFAGKTIRSKRGGHIPGACHLEWSNFVDQSGRFLSRDDIRTKLASVGLKPGSKVVSHCQSGGRAAVVAFAAELVGHPTQNYYLGWSDWGNAQDTPIDSETYPPDLDPQPLSQPPTKPPTP